MISARSPSQKIVGLADVTAIGCFGLSDIRFRDWPVDQVHVLPPSVDDHVSDKNHLALFVRDLVRTKLDLSEIKDAYAGAQGRPAYDPTTMTALIIYAYCFGMHSSREIVKACHERLGFKALTGD